MHTIIFLMFYVHNKKLKPLSVSSNVISVQLSFDYKVHKLLSFSEVRTYS